VKPLKITLAVMVVAAISAAIFFWMQSIDPPPPPPPIDNPFIAKIELEIEQLKAKPDNKFCKAFYKEIAYNINEFYKPLLPQYPYGRFGKTQAENDQRKENLESNLYFAYSEKFIMQAKTVFLGSEWKHDDLKFIQAEKNELKKSKFLHSGSPVDEEYTKIQTALNKYNEIVSFISSCTGYNYSNTELSARFPIGDVQSKIARAASLSKNRLENEFVNNCDRLHEGLKEIPLWLFRVHIRYLDDKITDWSGLYSNYNSQSDYVNNLYKPVKAEIDALDNDIYNAPNFDFEYNRLLSKWSGDNTKAYYHKYKK
jgi:hypothetical protein